MKGETVGADRIRRAAQTLRERAEDASPGPWRSRGNAVHDGGRGAVALTYDPRFTGDKDQTQKDAAYIATVDPRLGAELASLLEAIAVRADQITRAMPPVPDVSEAVLASNLIGYVAAARIADLINGA